MSKTTSTPNNPRQLYLCDDFTTGRYSIPLGRFTAERYARASLTRIYGPDSKQCVVYPCEFTADLVDTGRWVIKRGEQWVGYCHELPDGGVQTCGLLQQRTAPSIDDLLAELQREAALAWE